MVKIVCNADDETYLAVKHLSLVKKIGTGEVVLAILKQYLNERKEEEELTKAVEAVTRETANVSGNDEHTKRRQ